MEEEITTLITEQIIVISSLYPNYHIEVDIYITQSSNYTC